MRLRPENPFESFLQPGNLAVIKPNWVTHENKSGGGLDCLITHPSLIRSAVEWCARAMNGRGRIIIGDAPIQGCCFEKLIHNSGVADIVAALRTQYPALEITVADWRLTIWGSDKTPWGCEVAGQSSRATAEVLREYYSELDLGRDSFLDEISDYASGFRVTMYNPLPMLAHHQKSVHRYLLRKEAVEADLLINLPKMKTHQKAGVTGALKNLVGVNGHKEYLPHHIHGGYFSGGDAYCRENIFSRLADKVYDYWWRQEPGLRPLKRHFYNNLHKNLRRVAYILGGERTSLGSWPGNDTLWRTVLDLNHLVYFGEKRPRKILNIVDGVIAGEGDGPLNPKPKPAGLILLGENPAYIDAVICRLMGFNVARVPLVYHSVYHRRSRFAGPFLEDAPVFFVAQGGDFTPVAWQDLDNLHFAPPPGWQRVVRKATS